MDKNTLDGKDQWFFGGKLVHKILSCEPYVGRCKCFDCLSKEVFIFSHIQSQFSTFFANLARCRINCFASSQAKFIQNHFLRKRMFCKQNLRKKG